MLNIPNKTKIFSFFSGSGFLDLGFEMSNFDVVYVNEFYKPFLEAYKYSRQKMGLQEPEYGYHEGSIENLLENKDFAGLVSDAKKTNLIGFIGGPPCPDFSVAGKQRGKDGENGKLSKVYVDAILENKPDFFLFENVKGLWRTAKHRQFYEELKASLKEGGYYMTDRLTNSIEFGVPQDRDRILLFGIRKDLLTSSYNEELLSEEFDWSSQIKYQKDHLLDKSLWPTIDKFIENGNLEKGSHLKIIDEVTINHWFNLNQVEAHPNAKHYFKPKGGLSKFEKIPEGDVSKKSFKRLHRYRYSPTAAYGNNEVHLHPYLARRISAAEALAIQSLPKEFELPDTMTLSNMFKTIGNGVPYLVSKAIALTIYNYLESKKLINLQSDTFALHKKTG